MIWLGIPVTYMRYSGRGVIGANSKPKAVKGAFWMRIGWEDLRSMR